MAAAAEAGRPVRVGSRSRRRGGPGTGRPGRGSAGAASATKRDAIDAPRTIAAVRATMRNALAMSVRTEEHDAPAEPGVARRGAASRRGGAASPQRPVGAGRVDEQRPEPTSDRQPARRAPTPRASRGPSRRIAVDREPDDDVDGEDGAAEHREAAPSTSAGSRVVRRRAPRPSQNDDGLAADHQRRDPEEPTVGSARSGSEHQRPRRPARATSTTITIAERPRRGSPARAATS